ncbi:MAG TPA: argininosuccinate lyase [Candidatus Aminicenantes bacterium]|nr:argininosuccinate lyase [Candidatus Aminicenantes bacterium]HRY63713.1 argininosuccinate lyase [Candidatus Aminicenantes bacterium]HRZ73255.1 argininosuccinate lyase [Candidatus Aminicenantes bacterium]
MSGKVWGKRFAGRTAVPALERYNASIGEDAFLLQAEMEASRAYALGLSSAGVLDGDEAAAVLRGLAAVGRRLAAGEDLSRFEDVHSAVELLLIEEAGEPGRKLHTGRSRNEQVVTDERLFLKSALPAAAGAVADVQKALLALAESAPAAVMPGYTHLQRGQPVLFTHYALSFVWALERGKDRIADAARRLDVCPLGSGALAGSTVPLDRDALRVELGFAGLTENSIDAVADRSFILESLGALGLVLLDLSRLAEDLIIFASAEFGFIVLADAAATSSSLMPQKKNPDVLELLRAAPGRLFAHYARLFMVLKGTPWSYNKDLQEDKEPLRRGVEDALRALEAAAAAVRCVRPVPERMAAAIDPSIFATDLADVLVERGVAFREAHGVAAEAVRLAESSGRRLDGLKPDEFRGLHAALAALPAGLFDPRRSIERKKTAGSTNPEMVRRQLKKARALVDGSG